MNGVIPVIIIVVSILAFVFFMQPLVDEIKNINAKTESLEEALQNAKDFDIIQKSLLDKYNDISLEDLDNLKVMLPDKIDIVRMALDIETLARNNALVVVGGINGSEEQITKDKSEITNINIRPYNISVTLAGTYDGLLSFLEDVANSLVITDVSNLKFTEDKSEESFINQYAITLQTYFIK